MAICIRVCHTLLVRWDNSCAGIAALYASKTVRTSSCSLSSSSLKALEIVWTAIGVCLKHFFLVLLKRLDDCWQYLYIVCRCLYKSELGVPSQANIFKVSQPVWRCTLDAKAPKLSCSVCAGKCYQDKGEVVAASPPLFAEQHGTCILSPHTSQAGLGGLSHRVTLRLVLENTRD